MTNHLRIYNVERISKLLYKYVHGTLSEAEHEALMAWAKAHPDNLRLLKHVEKGNKLDADLADWFATPKKTLSDDLRLEAEVSKHERFLKVRHIHMWLRYAAAVIIILAVGTWFLTTRYQAPDTRYQASDGKPTPDVAPGGYRATLTLADGHTIDLSEAKTGIVVGDGIKYSDGSDVVRQRTGAKRRTGGSEGENLPATYYTLSTPKGGAYQITLPDGTEVWLNAASTLKYPDHFDEGERVVEVSGEAYFSVAKDVQKPFKVISDGQDVQVLGTEFNVSAYAENQEIKTTLVAGSVQIVNHRSHAVNRLKPNEQSVVRGTSTNIQHVDIELYTAWKNGYFYFQHTAFEEVMQQLARWYDVELVYKSEVPQETFSGEMGRDLTLGAALKLLNVSAVKVQIAPDNKLIVY